MSFNPGDDSTPELISIHQGFISIALSTFLIFMPPERIIFISKSNFLVIT